MRVAGIRMILVEIQIILPSQETLGHRLPWISDIDWEQEVTWVSQKYLSVDVHHESVI